VRPLVVLTNFIVGRCTRLVITPSPSDTALRASP
jgi:hypothetical protein